jgi:hypothetical protein
VAAYPEVDVYSLLGPDATRDPVDRLDAFVVKIADIFFESEQSYRTMLRLSLDTDLAARGELVLRKGRRYVWIEEALEPIRASLPGSEFERLVHAIAAATGIEALVELTDLGGLSRKRAVQVTRWAARALLQFALAGSDEE